MSSFIRSNNMQNSQLANDVKKAEKLLNAANKSLNGIMEFIEENDRINAINETFIYEEIAEKIVNQARLMPVNTGDNNAKSRLEEIIIKENNVEISYTNEGWFRVKMPFLLPKKERGNPSYIRATLNTSLKEYFKSHERHRFDECVFIVCHHYDESRPEREYRDHDNIELNAVIDTIALYVMIDDSPMKCRHYYCSTISESDYTEVFLVPGSDFVKWLNKFDCAAFS